MTKRQTTLSLSILAMVLFLVMAPSSPAQGQEEKKDGLKEKIQSSLEDFKKDVKEEVEVVWPKRVEDFKESLGRLKVVKKPETVLTSYPEDPELYEKIVKFYDFIKGRELDVAAEQSGMPKYFRDRDGYYDFLDTILPAMRDRRFERNRILEYQIHEIKKIEVKKGEGEKAGDEVDEKVSVLISATSDDTLPFGKVIIFRHIWTKDYKGWWPGKIEADPATYWERIR